MLKVIVEEVAFTPATVPSSNNKPVVKVVGEDQTASLPGTPAPVMLPPPQEVVYKEPELTPTQPVAKEDNVVDPLTPTVRRAVPVEEEIINGVLLPAIPATLKTA